MRRENKNLWTLRKYWGKDQVHTVMGGESSYWMELYVHILLADTWFHFLHFGALLKKKYSA